MAKRRIIDKEPAYWSHKYDFPMEEIWNTDNVLARFIAPRLLAFKALDKHFCPPDFDDMRKWNSAIQKMANAFELMKEPGWHSEAENARITEGLELFCKYYRDLSD